MDNDEDKGKKISFSVLFVGAEYPKRGGKW